MIEYFVQSGDTLSRIARRFGVSVRAIAQVNRIANTNVIFLGQRLLIPRSGNARPTPPPPPPSHMPSWFQIAQQEWRRGVHEIAGSQHQGRIIEYHASTTLRATTDETAWCSSFVNWCVQRAGKRGTRSAAARSWLNWRGGREIRDPRRGAIAILWRGNRQGRQGHVAFIDRVSRSHIYLLGGNQGDAVNVSRYRMSRVLGYRWPR